MSNYTSGGNATTVYVGGILEKVTTSAGTEYRHMIRAGGATVVVSRQSGGTNTTNYVTSEHLGSNAVITSSSGAMLTSLSFDAFGKRRGSNWTGSPSAGDWTAIAATTRRGFTDHTMLDNLGLIHMNGRVQDPSLGKFASADPLIAAPGFTQSFNRYSYVYNSPLSYIDPSGFTTTGTANDDGEHHDCRSSGSVCADSARARAEEERQRTGGERDEEVRRGTTTSANPTGSKDPESPNPRQPTATGNPANSTPLASGCRAVIDKLRSNLSGVGAGIIEGSGTSVPKLNTEVEEMAMDRFARGDTSVWHMPPDIFRTLSATVARYPRLIRGSPLVPGMRNERQIKMGLVEGQFDFLLGTATATFRPDGEMDGLRDTFNFDPKDRGSKMMADFMARLNRDLQKNCPGFNPDGFPIRYP